MSDGYDTLAGPCEVEIDKVKRSRFIGLAAPCADEAQAQAFVDACRARFHDARHLPFAWRIGDNTRASDDGEPSRSAGPPILRAIEGRDLDRVVVAVARYFGGVKLGTGGLSRAFGAAAAAALEAGEVLRVDIRTPLVVTVDYAGASAVQRALHELKIEPASAEYAAEICLTLHLEAERVPAVQQRLRDASGGAARMAVLDPVALASY
jgi:uncharacterized YigZ family protein